MMKRAMMLVVILVGVAVGADEPKPNAEGWIMLFNGKDKEGWHPRHAGHDGWSVQEGLLVNAVPSVDIVSDVPQGDFELHVEFNVPKGSNSGVYLQGRYEIQVDDSFGAAPDSHHTGGIYGKITPKVNAAKAAGEWQTFDATFHQATLGDDGKVSKKAHVTVIHNGQKIIDDGEIDGATGSAVDTKEGKPAGLMLQGDHGPVSFRNLKMRPLKAEAK